MAKNCYAAFGSDPTNKISGFYLKIGETIHEDLSLRSTYLQHGEVLLKNGKPTFQLIDVNGNEINDHDVRWIISQHPKLSKKWRVKKGIFVGREQVDCEDQALIIAHANMVRDQLNPNNKHLTEQIYQDFRDKYLTPAWQEICDVVTKQPKPQFIIKNENDKNDADIIATNIISFCLISNRRERNIYDIFDSAQRDQELFKRHVGYTIDEFRQKEFTFDQSSLIEREIKKYFEAQEKLEKITDVERRINFVLNEIIPLLKYAPGTDIMRQFVATPLHLVEKMLDMFPIETWRDKNKTFFDPTCGRGTFVLSIIKRLFNGLKTEFSTENIRLAHILEKMVYANDNNEGQIERLRSIIKLATGFSGLKNITCQDALNYNFDMQFDVVVGNPPYNGEEHQFVEIANQKSFEHCFVLPPTWLHNEKASKIRELITIKNILVVNNTFKGVDLDKVVITKCSHKLASENPQNLIALSSSTIEKSIIDKIISAGHLKSLIIWNPSYKFAANEIEREYVDDYISANRQSKSVLRIEKRFKEEFNSTWRRHQDVAIGKRSVKINDSVTAKIIQLRQKMILYPEFCRFRSNSGPFQNPKAIVDAMPCTHKLIAVASDENNVQRTVAFLQSKTMLVFLKAFYSDVHIKNNYLRFKIPDITHLLPENPNENDIMSAFNFSKDEQNCILNTTRV